MEVSKNPCERHEEQLKNMAKEITRLETKILKNSSIKDYVDNLDKNLAVQTQMLTYIVEHNQKQDARMDKQEIRMDKQDVIASEQHDVIVKINHNLTELNNSQKSLATKIKSIEDTQREAELKETIHTGELFRNFILKVALPVGIIGAMIVQVMKAILK